MENLKTGRFYGQTNSTIHLDFATITDTEYTHDKVDWHYHDNAYFTFILDGKVIEGNKKEVYNCTAGSLLFHNWQDAHYNIKPKGFTRGFHIELNESWFGNYPQYVNTLQGSFAVANPDVKFLFYQLFRETKLQDDAMPLATEVLLLQVLAQMQQHSVSVAKQRPVWVGQLRNMLHDNITHKFTLAELSASLQVHPVHLSRDFSKYFHCNLGEYIRKLRVEKALALMPNENLSLTDIAHICGFADQSHFLRSFKSFNGANPKVYRKLLLRAC
ncbi:helix-turn-helix domain-containing protein [Mucilaginibacter pedocola]|uniref:AraC family transcriptional regulator n=1 Tax=Mucilaginibacter pedocola TaxID=1792845 RepID=A0A1S9P877_9SPHI|nr:AraC family transcriptional regulator [Mucilaginibacter pedocola]OOQ56858.1 AraC family transcriptional regulator [Mucilaginibacter pedocola]